MPTLPFTQLLGSRDRSITSDTGHRPSLATSSTPSPSLSSTSARSSSSIATSIASVVYGALAKGLKVALDLLTPPFSPSWSITLVIIAIPRFGGDVVEET